MFYAVIGWHVTLSNYLHLLLQVTAFEHWHVSSVHVPVHWLNSHHLHRASVSEVLMHAPYAIWPPLCPSFVHLLVCSLQEEEDLQSEVTVRRWSSLPPYSDQQCGFDGAEIGEGCCGGNGLRRGLGLLFPLICILFNLRPHLSLPPLSVLSPSLSSFFLVVTILCPSLSANILFLISSQFCSCFLTTSTIPLVSILNEKTFL